MNIPIDDQVVDFYYVLFDRIFSEPFRSRIADRVKRDGVIRQVEDSAAAASQSLTRFFLNQQLTEQQVTDLLDSFARLRELLKLDDIANPNVTPETVVDGLLADLRWPEAMRQAGHDAVYRVALHSVVQVLMLVGPVMAEWQKLSFSSTFELPRRVVNRLNQISEQLGILGRAGQVAADERYELSYRDYLLQRFHRVEAGTIRMTTNLDVDLRELFVMPRVLVRPLPEKSDSAAPTTDAAALMDLAAARKFFAGGGEPDEYTEPMKHEEAGIPALDQTNRYPRNVIVGVPGSGKSTFLEWLQLKLASVEEELVIAGGQAIPVLLRVRQLDPRNLPCGSELIEKATASRDRAALMPLGWIDRHMKDGRVLFMLDGLDEVEPELRDNYVLPWLRDICQQYPKCWYLISSRPVGYPPGMFRTLGFGECELLNFGEDEVSDYTRHWCTAVRLARNEPAEEARREGAADGQRIVDGFRDYPFIRNLASNPLMLSAICLVNYFEGGELPQDRALLYKLCVEGLLHHWDQRRGIRSEFGLEEKLRCCREVALAMQADDRAEYEAEKVQEVFAGVLSDPPRAENLRDHIRRRTGLLVERRPGVFAFAHLTFQEYLAARAVHEGNRLGIDVERLVREHDDDRWQEVIALYCGQAPSPSTCDLIERLMAQPDTLALGAVLAEAYVLGGPELSQDHKLRRRVLERIVITPGRWPSTLERFPAQDVAPIANLFVGKTVSELGISEAHRWLHRHPDALDATCLAERLRGWQKMNPGQAAELIHLLHAHGRGNVLAEIASDTDMYAAPRPELAKPTVHGSQAEVALIGLSHRSIRQSDLPDIDTAFLQVLRTLSDPKNSLASGQEFLISIPMVLEKRGKEGPPQDAATWPEFASLARGLLERLAKIKVRDPDPDREGAIAALNSWAESLERAIGARARQQTKPESKLRGKTANKRAPKKKPKKR